MHLKKLPGLKWPGQMLFASLKRRIEAWIRREIVDDDPWDEHRWNVEELSALSTLSKIPEPDSPDTDPSEQLTEQPEPYGSTHSPNGLTESSPAKARGARTTSSAISGTPAETEQQSG